MEKQRGIQYFPIGLFASVMGFSGVTIATKNLENLYGWNAIGSTILMVITVLIFLLNLGILLYRLFRHSDEVKADFNHPMKMNFFGAISISMLLLAVIFLDVSSEMSFIFWILGALLQITLTLVILSRLIWIFKFQIAQFNPAWFIPIVGNIIVPIAGMEHVIADVNWFFFSIGIVFSIVYMTIFFNRAYFQPTLPPKLLPTFFILMAPPAIGTVSYVKLTGSLDAFAYILYGTAFFIGLLLLFQLKRFFSIPFFITWWAFLFPSAAMTIATFMMYVNSGNSLYEWLFILQIVGLIVLTVYLTWQTIRLAINRSLCVKD